MPEGRSRGVAESRGREVAKLRAEPRHCSHHEVGAILALLLCATQDKREVPPALRSVGMTRLVVVAGGKGVLWEGMATRLRRVEIKREVPHPAARGFGMTR